MQDYNTTPFLWLFMNEQNKYYVIFLRSGSKCKDIDNVVLLITFTMYICVMGDEVSQRSG